MTGGNADERLDDLAAFRIRCADHGGLGHRGVRKEDVLDFGGADTKTRTLDEIVVAATIPIVAIVIADCQVMRTNPLAEAHSRGEVRPAPVAEKQRRRIVRGNDFSDLPIGNRFARFIDQRCDVTRKFPAHRTRADGAQLAAIADHMIDLGHAIAFVAHDTQLILQPVERLARQRFATGKYSPQSQIPPLAR